MTSNHHVAVWIDHHEARLFQIVAVETVDHPTDRQIVAYAKKYFDADDRMQGRPSPHVT